MRTMIDKLIDRWDVKIAKYMQFKSMLALFQRNDRNVFFGHSLRSRNKYRSKQKD